MGALSTREIGASSKGELVVSTGGLIALEAAFKLIDIPDPCPRQEWRGRLAAFEAGVGYGRWLVRPRQRVQKGDERWRG